MKKTIFESTKLVYLRMFYILLFMTVSSNNFAQPTLLGLHGITEDYPTIGAKVLRFGANDYRIKTAIQNNDQTLLNHVMKTNSLGYTNICYLIHNKDIVVNPVDTAWQRIPTGNDRIEVFKYLDTFLTIIGPYIEYVQINQEPMGITPYDTNIYSLNDILNWWRTLAEFIDEKRALNPSTLGHLKILSPSISRMQTSPSKVVDSMIVFGENYCDAISLHIYPETVEEGKEVIDYYRSKTNQTLACSEFSQAMAGIHTGWLNNVNTVWTNNGDLYFGLTNKEVMYSAYNNPMESTAWQAFIATAPYTVNFIPEMYAAMDSNCFAFACYAGMWQYGEPIFDWAELLTNKTVKQFPFPNEPFYSEFTALTSLINSNNYQSQCPNLTINEKSFINRDITVFPNPSTYQVTIKSEQNMDNASLCIFNQLGQQIGQTKFISGKEYTINTTNMPSGTYYIRIIFSDQSSFTEKIILNNH